MKILFINNFLFTVGGVETYIKSLSEELVNLGHDVQFFGMDDSRNFFSNRYGIYSRKIDLKTKNLLKLFYYSFSLIYSIRNKIRLTKLLLLLKPDIVHLNNINYNLTTSIFDPIRKLRIPIVKTIHDAQISCSNHRLLIPDKNIPCTKCNSGNFTHALRNKCIDGSFSKSFLGMIESYFNHIFKRYLKIDLFIFPSKFMLENHSKLYLNNSKFIFLPNFARLNKVQSDLIPINPVIFDNYCLFFGRLSVEKGIHLIIKLSKNFPNENFVFVGSGPMKASIPTNQSNIQVLDFISDNTLLSSIISAAKLTFSPSIWYENSPLNVIESINLGTPVLGSNIGGIPEFISDGINGKLFKSGNYEDFSNKFIEAIKLKGFNVQSDFNSMINSKQYANNLIKKYEELIINSQKI